MKSISKFLYVFIAFVLVGLAACEKEHLTADMSKITYYPLFEYAGEEVIFMKRGGTYTEPGVTASENNANIPVTVEVTGIYTGYSGTTLPSNVADKYLILYTAVNSDKFSASKERIVWVYDDADLTTGIVGLYTSTVGRGIPPANATAQYTDMKYVLISHIEGNRYFISDALGAYYEIGRKYGEGYAYRGAIITVNDFAANSFSTTVGISSSWGDASTIENFSVNPNGTITYTGKAPFATNFTFNVELKKANL